MPKPIEDWKNALKEAGLENAGIGVVFPWGAKIVDFEGKKFLEALTSDEHCVLHEKVTGKILPDPGRPPCVYVGGGDCRSQGCVGTCESHHIPGHDSYSCHCVY